jgi:hypothetical protein
MATIIRFGAQRGFNVDQVAEWTYSEKVPAKATGAVQSIIVLTFTGGHEMTVEGEDAAALHRYLRTVGSSLT